MVWRISTASLSKCHKDECLSSPCAVRVETNSDWQMGRGHPVNIHTGQGDIKMSFTGQLIKGGSPHTHIYNRVQYLQALQLTHT